MDENQKLYERYRTAGFSDTGWAAVVEGYSQLVDLLPSNHAVPLLDFGCGGGEFLEFARDLGFLEASGIDRSPEQVDRCRARGLPAVELVNDPLAWLGGHRRCFGAVVMNDVLEHIPKDSVVATLEAVREALVPGGVLVVKVPNAANAFGLVARYLDFTHEVAFTEHSLHQVLVIAGFSNIAVQGLAVKWRPTIRRSLYWAANGLYRFGHALVYRAAVGTDAPRVLTKLLVVRAEAPL